MSIANKFNIPPALLETIKRMNAEGTEYQEKVKALLKKKGFTSIGQMSSEEKKDFFNTLDSMHKAKNEEVELEEATIPTNTYRPRENGRFVRRKIKGQTHEKDPHGGGTLAKNKPPINKEEVEQIDEKMTRQEIQKELEKVRNEIQRLGQMADGRNNQQSIDSRRRAIRPYARRRQELEAMLDAMKEEVELDEAFPKSTQYALVHSSSKKIVAKGNKKEMTKKVKELNAKEKGSHYVGISYGSKVGDTFGFGPSPADKLSVRNEEVEKLDEVKVGDKVHLGLKQKGGSGMRGTVHKIEGDKVYVNLGKEKFGDRIVMGSMKNVTKEEVNLDEAKSSTGYDLYHKDFSSAMQHAYDFAKKKYNIEIDPTEIDRNVAMGPRKPGSGKANAYRLLDKTGKKAIQVQVANLDNKRYELNMYKEDVDQIDEVSKKTLSSYVDKAPDSVKNLEKTSKDVKALGGFDAFAGQIDKKIDKRRSAMANATKKMSMKKEDVDQIVEVKVGDKVSFSHSVAAAGGRSVKKTGTVHQIDGDTVHVKVKDKYGVMTHKKKTNDLMKEDVELKEDAKSAAEKIETYAKTLSTGDMDKKDFMKVASMLKRNKVKEAVKFAMNLDSDPRDYILTTLENNKVNFREEIELAEKGPGLWANIRAKRARGEKMRKPGEKGAPTEDQIRSAKNEEFEDVNESQFKPGYEFKAPGYDQRVQELENKGMSTSDAQGVADTEVRSGKHKNWKQSSKKNMKEEIELTESDFKVGDDVIFKESDASYAAGKEKEKESKLTPSDKDKLAKIRAMMGKEKKPMKEEIELTEKVSPAQIDRMRQEYDKIKGIDPASDNYKKLTTMLDKLDLKTLQTLAGAKIKFVSGLAQNRVVRKMNEEVEELDEISADVAKRVAQKRDQDLRKGTPTVTQKRRMGRGDWRADPQLHADKARQSAEKRGAKDVYDYNKKEEVEFDEASNPQMSMKRAGLSVERAKEVVRHQKQIGTIRKKREALRNSYDPAIIEAYKKMKKKNEVTKDDNKIIKSSDKLSGKQEPIELDPELKEQKR